MRKKIMLMMVAVAVLGFGIAILAQDNDGNDGKSGRKNKGDKEARETAREKARENRDDIKDKIDANKENKRENRTDKRQDNQEKRIQHGINKGYLTPEETKSLQNQQQQIASMESSYKSDGKLTKDEMSSLRDALNVASANIWAEKHDTDGKQMATYRLGKNVYAKDSFTSAMSNQSMTGAEAKALASDFRKMLSLKNSLANDNLSAEQRAQKQNEYNELLNRYFEVR
ncbi:MAG TPA: hypothetical protein DCZ94_00820 [Lentisphaeria bacterium]|nr:MAG: hypothetical protein A2X48_11950 [Lentisphaerae bacterium GWF2_49_21]HBC85473.1 hypothetical protein [Lentisphaeria bacterium]